MPTVPERQALRAEAVACFEAQTWPNRELVIVDGPGTIGAKRNEAVAQARGEVIVHWDDDDWSAPDRIEDQVTRLVETGAEITGYWTMHFFDALTGRWWLYTGRTDYALGTSLCYWRKTWQARPFEPIQVGEDDDFQRGRRLVTVPAGPRMWARIHSGSTDAKITRFEKNNRWRAL